MALPANFTTDVTVTMVFVIIDNALAGCIALSDEILPESFGARQELKKNNIKSILLTAIIKRSRKQ